MKSSVLPTLAATCDCAMSLNTMCSISHPLCLDTQIPEADWDAIKAALLAVCAGTSRSSKPAIYGLAAEAELRRLRPLSTMTSNMEVGCFTAGTAPFPYEHYQIKWAPITFVSAGMM